MPRMPTKGAEAAEVATEAMAIRFVKRIALPAQQDEDIDTARLVIGFQGGETGTFHALYKRYFDRLYGYMKVALHDAHEAEDATQQVFMQVFEALPRYERRPGQPFRAWLFVVARNCAIAYAQRLERVDVEDVEDLNRRRDESVEPSGDLDILNWISDRDLTVLIERLPLPQRQVVMLRFVYGFSPRDTARVLDRTPASVRMLQSRATDFLRDRLTALGHAPAGRSRATAQVWRRQSRVLRARRFTLSSSGPSR